MAALLHFSEAHDALAHLQTLYRQQIQHLRTAMQAYVDGHELTAPARAFYPLLRIQAHTVRRPDTRLAYGFLDHPGTYETTITRPDLFAKYLLTQLTLLQQNHDIQF